MSPVATRPAPRCTVHLKRPHPRQQEFLRSRASRKVIRAGRRSGKTTGLAIYAVEEFLKGHRVLYAVPTLDQVQRFWHEVSMALTEPVEAGVFKRNLSTHTIEREQTEQRIRAKTAWDADSLRGDYASRLILDEYQLMNEDAWAIVGAPMLLDKAGSTATFCYTPPSFRQAGRSKAHDPRHAAKLFDQARQDTSGRWAAFHFTSHDNPYLAQSALEEIAADMSTLAYKQEIMAEDVEEIPGALWTLRGLDASRCKVVPEFTRIVVGIDPGHHAGVVVAALGEDKHAYVLEDMSVSGSPETWADQAVAGYYKYRADCLVPERNHGGEMVASTIRQVDRNVHVKTVWASHGKYARAEPISALYAKGMVHHVGVFPDLEGEMCSWLPEAGYPSPNRMDALVWALTELLLGVEKRAGAWGRD